VIILSFIRGRERVEVMIQSSFCADLHYFLPQKSLLFNIRNQQNPKQQQQNHREKEPAKSEQKISN